MFEHQNSLLSYLGRSDCHMLSDSFVHYATLANCVVVQYIETVIKDLPQDDENLSNFAEVSKPLSCLIHTEDCNQFPKLQQYAIVHKDTVSNNYLLIKHQDSSMIEEITLWLHGIILDYDLPPILSETQ